MSLCSHDLLVTSYYCNKLNTSRAAVKLVYMAPGFYMVKHHHINFYVFTVFLVPSFDSKTVLQLITSNSSANTITVYIPLIDDSGGPIRYSPIV